MGIDLALCRFLDAAAAGGSLPEPVLGLGNLTVNVNEVGRQRMCAMLGLTEGVRPTVRELLARRYGVGAYTDCDINDLADLNLDLSQPVPPELHGHFGSIMNFGTLEHVFDQRQIMTNMHDLVRPGGLILHTVPVTWFEHGFFNINPVMLRLTAHANGYTLVVEGYHLLEGALDGLPEAAVWLEGDATAPSSTRRMQDILAGPWLPANMMYLAAYRREGAAAFVIPQQIGYS